MNNNIEIKVLYDLVRLLINLARVPNDCMPNDCMPNDRMPNVHVHSADEEKRVVKLCVYKGERMVAVVRANEFGLIYEVLCDLNWRECIIVYKEIKSFNESFDRLCKSIVQGLPKEFGLCSNGEVSKPVVIKYREREESHTVEKVNGDTIKRIVVKCHGETISEASFKTHRDGRESLNYDVYF